MDETYGAAVGRDNILEMHVWPEFEQLVQMKNEETLGWAWQPYQQICQATKGKLFRVES